MATRSTIRIATPEFKSKAIYCHWDGYPSNMKPMLENYDTVEKAKELINLGDLSQLGDDTESCVAYCRDRGEAKAWSGDGRQEYNYSFNGTFWEVI